MPAEQHESAKDLQVSEWNAAIQWIKLTNVCRKLKLNVSSVPEPAWYGPSLFDLRVGVDEYIFQNKYFVWISSRSKTTWIKDYFLKSWWLFFVPDVDYHDKWQRIHRKAVWYWKDRWNWRLCSVKMKTFKKRRYRTISHHTIFDRTLYFTFGILFKG